MVMMVLWLEEYCNSAVLYVIEQDAEVASECIADYLMCQLQGIKIVEISMQHVTQSLLHVANNDM